MRYPSIPGTSSLSSSAPSAPRSQTSALLCMLLAEGGLALKINLLNKLTQRVTDLIEKIKIETDADKDKLIKMLETLRDDIKQKVTKASNDVKL
jgi:hypothetical protein